jgi:hypothetical protein
MRRLLAALAITATVLGLAACAAPPALPTGITVEAFQNRLDYGARVLELKVANDSGAPFTVTAATFESNRFAEPAAWTRSTDIPVGSARDLKVQLSAAVCDETATSKATVRIDFVLADGTTGSGTLTPSDPNDQLAKINSDDCLLVAASKHASIAAADTLQWTPGARTPATLDIVLTPTEADGTLTITGARDTILFALVADDGSALTLQDLHVVIDAKSPKTVIHLRLQPQRCDVHAVAEDKRGTFFPIYFATSGGAKGAYSVPVSPEVKAELYAYIGSWCAA